jgi:acyl-coenzyme A thioesterase PaaI-like protein
VPDRALDNAAWGFASSCFVCDQANPRGLRVAFRHDTDRDVVWAEMTFGPDLSGAPRYVHGGVVLAVLDEAMAWAAIAVAGRFAVVQHTATTFDRPMKLEAPHRVEAVVVGSDDRTVTVKAHLSDLDERVCARAHARLAVLSDATALSAIGEVKGDDVHYLRRDAP